MRLYFAGENWKRSLLFPRSGLIRHENRTFRNDSWKCRLFVFIWNIILKTDLCEKEGGSTITIKHKSKMSGDCFVSSRALSMESKAPLCLGPTTTNEVGGVLLTMLGCCCCAGFCWRRWRWVQRLRPVLFLKYSNNFKEKEILLFYGFLGLNCNLL